LNNSDKKVKAFTNKLDNDDSLKFSTAYDIVNFYKTLEYYRKTSAPFVLIKSIIKTRKVWYFYEKE